MLLLATFSALATDAEARSGAWMTGHDTLVERAKRGDADALGQLVVREGPRVARLLTRMLGPRQDLEDLTQNVFLELCRALPSFRGDSKMSTFVGGITVRIARRALRPSAYDRTKTELVAEPMAAGPDPEARTSLSEQMRRIQHVLDQMTAKKRIAFCLYYLEGMSAKEVAQTMGATVAATRARIYYAKREFRASAEREPYLQEIFEGHSS